MGSQNWYALQIRPNHEQVSEIGLRGKGYEVFLPTYRKDIHRRNRSLSAEFPLFPGYLFCRVKPECNGHIVTTPGVMRIVAFGGKAATIDDQEIADVRTIINSEVLHEPWQYLSTGCTVQIKSGPLEGLNGILISAKRFHKIVVSVNILQRSVAAVLDTGTTVSILCMPNHSDRQNENVPASLIRHLITATPPAAVYAQSTQGVLGRAGK